jgi:Alr-MurF fusion protein
VYTIEEIGKAVQAKVSLHNPASVIKILLTDSRKLEQPDTSLFFAISGERLNGHHYIGDLYAKGVRNFVVEDDSYIEKFPEANFLHVKKTTDALQKAAVFHRKQFNIPVAGITGSNGKTIVKEWCHQLLHDDFSVVRSPKSYNSQIGVPLSVWNMNASHNLAIFEAGISEPGEMENLEKIILPEIGIYTNIGAAHGANFISEEHKIKEKLRLFVRAKTLIYCADHANIHNIIIEMWGKSKSDKSHFPDLLSWGKNPQSYYVIESQETLLSHTRITLKHSKKKHHFEIPFVDESSVENAIHCIVLMLHLHLSDERINERLGKLQRIAMRLEQKTGVNNCLIINDSYNSDIDSLKIALDFLSQQQQQSNRTLILSDILQSGISTVDLYTTVYGLIKNAQIQKFIGIGPALMQNKYLFNDNSSAVQCLFYPSTGDFLSAVNDSDFKDEAILLKGARKFEFEKISNFLEEKAHATVLEINLSAILHNFSFFNSRLKEGTKMMVMVKALSYGAGAFEIAKMLEFHRVDYFGVAYTDEGVALRKAGIKTPILVLNPEERSFEAMIRYRLEPEIYSFRLLESFRRSVEMAKLSEPYPIHIDIDTGMRRLGFEKEEIESLISVLKSNELLQVAGVFSHLAAADESKWDDFTRNQIQLFDELSTKLSDELGINPIRHIANTNGIARFPEANFDMVRLGIGLYGINEKYQSKLQVAGTLKSTISQIKHVPKGETVGYGRVGVAKKDMRIATIAIGYADGLNRLLSNGKGSVWLNGKRAPVVGNICMDMTMIDITAIPEAQEGDAVEIFGENITVAEMAEQLSTIPYEILTSVSQRVKRVYFVD